jgi:hypothetical protein
MKKRQQPNVEGIWADPEAVLRPTKGERLAALIQEFEDEQYPQMMALGWLKQTLDRLPQNQTSLTRQSRNQTGKAMMPEWALSY